MVCPHLLDKKRFDGIGFARSFNHHLPRPSELFLVMEDGSAEMDLVDSARDSGFAGTFLLSLLLARPLLPRLGAESPTITIA